MLTESQIRARIRSQLRASLLLTDIANLMKQTFKTVPELAGVVVDVADTSEEVIDAIEAA